MENWRFARNLASLDFKYFIFEVCNNNLHISINRNYYYADKAQLFVLYYETEKFFSAARIKIEGKYVIVEIKVQSWHYVLLYVLS